MAEKNYFKIEEFDIKNTEKTGGVTGSKKVLHKEENKNYQLKFSILDAKPIRRIKASGLEQENFGELIAANVSRSITNPNPELELIPKVVLVYDKDKNRCLVASRYLDNVQSGNLDAYATKTQGAKVQSGHVKVIADGNLAKKGELNIAANVPGIGMQNSTFRKDLASAIVISALSGDHDVNPGNLMVIKEKDSQGKAVGHDRIARIDFGHAFNDLLRAPRALGGQVRNKNNNVLDFFNRETVSHLNPTHQETKLWKSYAGIVPSQEMIDALREIGNSKNVKQGLDVSKSAFKELIKDLEAEKDPKKLKENKKTISHIKDSLSSISKNVGEGKIKTKNTEEFLDKAFNNLEKYYTNNQKHMLQVANVMDLQLKIDKVIIDQKLGKNIPMSSLEPLYNSYDKLAAKDSSVSMGNGRIEWIKSDKDVSAFKGNFNQYFEHRKQTLQVDLNVNKSKNQPSVNINADHKQQSPKQQPKEPFHGHNFGDKILNTISEISEKLLGKVNVTNKSTNVPIISKANNKQRNQPGSRSPH